MTILEAGEEP
jgi:hypothetical protein